MVKKEDLCASFFFICTMNQHPCSYKFKFYHRLTETNSTCIHEH